MTRLAEGFSSAAGSSLHAGPYVWGKVWYLFQTNCCTMHVISVEIVEMTVHGLQLGEVQLKSVGRHEKRYLSSPSDTGPL